MTRRRDPPRPLYVCCFGIRLLQRTDERANERTNKLIDATPTPLSTYPPEYCVRDLGLRLAEVLLGGYRAHESAGFGRSKVGHSLEKHTVTGCSVPESELRKLTHTRVPPRLDSAESTSRWRRKSTNMKSVLQCSAVRRKRAERAKTPR